MSELLLGCGVDRTKRLWMPDEGMKKEWTELTTLDFNEVNNPDVVWDLNEFPYPFSDDTFDEIHAYEVLEHLGSQGDFKFFFDGFYQLWRILKGGGLLVITCPRWDKIWAWSDPGHTRVISPAALTFLDQTRYSETDTTRTDYRRWWDGDFMPVHYQQDDDTMVAVLRARKE